MKTLNVDASFGELFCEVEQIIITPGNWKSIYRTFFIMEYIRGLFDKKGESKYDTYSVIWGVTF